MNRAKVTMLLGAEGAGVNTNKAGVNDDGAGVSTMAEQA